MSEDELANNIKQLQMKLEQIEQKHEIKILIIKHQRVSIYIQSLALPSVAAPALLLLLALKLSKWTWFLSEEWQAFLLDNRQAWYAERPLNWRTHLMVSWKTLKFVVVQVLCEQSKEQIKQRFQPLYRPRLFGK